MGNQDSYKSGQVLVIVTFISVLKAPFVVIKRKVNQWWQFRPESEESLEQKLGEEWTSPFISVIKKLPNDDHLNVKQLTIYFLVQKGKDDSQICTVYSDWFFPVWCYKRAGFQKCQLYLPPPPLFPYQGAESKEPSKTHWYIQVSVI